MAANDVTRAVAKIHGHAWADPEFRARLKKDPHGVLKEHGLNAPDHLTIHVHESSDSVAHWVIPPRPEELSGEGEASSDICSIAPDFCSIAADEAHAPHPNICSI